MFGIVAKKGPHSAGGRERSKAHGGEAVPILAAWRREPTDAGSPGRPRSSRPPPGSRACSGLCARSSPPTTSARAARSTPSRSPSRSRTSCGRSSPTPPSPPPSCPSSASCSRRASSARAWRVASTVFWLFLLGLGGLTALFVLAAPLLIPPLDGRLRRPGRHAVADPLPDRRPDRLLRDRHRDPEQLRPVLDPGSHAGLLEPRDHPRPRPRRAQGGHGQRQALRLRRLDRRRHADPAAAAAAVAARPRRPPEARARRPRSRRADRCSS